MSIGMKIDSNKINNWAGNLQQGINNKRILQTRICHPFILVNHISDSICGVFFFSILRYSCIQSDFRCLAYAEKTNESILFFINFLLNYCVYARTSPLCSQCQTLGIIRIRIYLHGLAHTQTQLQTKLFHSIMFNICQMKQ